MYENVHVNNNTENKLLRFLFSLTRHVILTNILYTRKSLTGPPVNPRLENTVAFIFKLMGDTVQVQVEVEVPRSLLQLHETSDHHGMSS